MRNLQYEMRICQKSHTELTKTVYVWFEFLCIRRYSYEYKKLRYEQSLSTTSNMDRELLRRKSRQKFSVMKIIKLEFPER